MNILFFLKYSYTSILLLHLVYFQYVTNIDSKAVFRTNKNAPNYKLIAIDLLDYEQHKWVDLLPEHPENVLDWANAVDGDKFVACYIQDVKVNIKKLIRYSD